MLERARAKPKWRDLSWSERYARQKALWHYQMARLDHDQAQALRALAKRDGTTVVEKIRTFIEWGLENDYKGADRD